MNIHPPGIQTKLLKTVKVDNGDGSYSVTDTFQYDVVRTVKVADKQAQITKLQAEIQDLPVGAVPKQ